MPERRIGLELKTPADPSTAGYAAALPRGARARSRRNNDVTETLTLQHKRAAASRLLRDLAGVRFHFGFGNLLGFVDREQQVIAKVVAAVHAAPAEIKIQFGAFGKP